jgi:hypothetical protein
MSNKSKPSYANIAKNTEKIILEKTKLEQKLEQILEQIL